jgi:predicted molibdopterin-dependent oxidoreductase YjgC
MKINTRSKAVLENRKITVKLMLASHPDSCIVCEKGNRCKLRKVAAELGIGLVDFYPMPFYGPKQELNPFIERDLGKCILCGKCIRADHELVVEGAIEYVDRGFRAKPSTLSDGPLEESEECTFCGTCVSVCPTGALSETLGLRRRHSTASRRIDSTCPLCGCGCSLWLETGEEEVVGVSPRVGEPSINGVTLCAKGHYGYDFLHHPDRLTVPLVRKEGELAEASWEEALREVAERFQQIKERAGGRALGVLGSARITNEENYVLQKWARVCLQTNNIDSGSRLYGAPTFAAFEMTLGVGGMTNPVADLEKAQAILVIGANPQVSSPIAGFAIKRAVREAGAALVLVDPRATKLAHFATVHLRPRPNSDLALIGGMIRTVIAEGLEDKDFAEKLGDDYATLRERVEPYTAEVLEATCGVARDDFLEATRLFAGAERAAIVYGNGIAQQSHATAEIGALICLALVTGNLGGEGTGIYPLLREVNAQGTWDMGVRPDGLPGFRSLTDSGAREAMAGIWKAPVPEEPGLTVGEMLTEGSPVQAMFITGEDPAGAFPAPHAVRQRLESLDFLVVQDLFLTDTARLADVVLPLSSFAEKEGTFTTMERRIRKVRRAMPPVGSSRPVWEVLADLSRMMGADQVCESPEVVFGEITQANPFYAGIDRSRLDGQAVFWPAGRTRLFEEGPSLEGSLCEVMEPQAGQSQKTEGQYPHTLIVGSTLHRLGSDPRGAKSRRISRMVSQSGVSMCRSDLEKLNLKEGERVRLTSPRGEVEAHIAVGEDLPAGFLFMPLCAGDGSPLALMGLELELISKTPSMKTCQVRLERMEP